MNNLAITSQVTFLYFFDYQQACKFIDDTFGFPIVYNPGWACIWRTAGQAFIGAVDAQKGSIKDISPDKSVLVSLTVENAEEWYKKLKNYKLEGLTDIKILSEIGIRSFFFKGPEGYNFEIQEFLSSELRSIF